MNDIRKYMNIVEARSKFYNPGEREGDATPRDPNTPDMFDAGEGRKANPNIIGPLNGKYFVAKVKEIWNGKTGPTQSNIVRGAARVTAVSQSDITVRKGRGTSMLMPFGSKRTLGSLVKRSGTLNGAKKKMSYFK